MDGIIKKVIDHRVFSTLFLIAVAVLVRINIFQNQFVIDDIDYIVDWPLIQNWKNWPQFFVGYVPLETQEGIYSPFKTLFHAISYHLFGLNVIGHHVVSILVHICGILMVKEICTYLTKEPTVAFIAALVFAVHPVQVEAITSMTASIDMIGIIFLFLSFFFYMKAHNTEGKIIHANYVHAMFFSVLAIYTHELAVSLPLLFLWYEVCLQKKIKSFWIKLMRVFPFLFFVLMYAFAKYINLGSVARGSYLYDSFYLTFLVIIKAFAKYVIICFYPAVLTHDQIIAPGIYSFDPTDFDRFAVLSQSIFEFHTFLSLLILGTLFFFALRYYKEKPLITFSIGWFFIALLPGANIIPTGVYFAERYMYPGMLGFSLVFAMGMCRLMRNTRYSFFTVLLFVGILVGFSVRSIVRNKDWRDEVTFYEAAVRSNVNSALMRTELGVVYARNDMLDKALTSFHQALSMRDDDAETYFVMADVYSVKGQYKDAQNALEKAIDLNPDYAEAFFNLAGIQAYLGNLQEAYDSLDRSLTLYRAQGRDKAAQELEASFKNYFGEEPS